MSRNENFLVARRRNALLRDGKSFIKRIARAVDGRLAAATFLDPVDSLLLERRVWRDADSDASHGKVVRKEGLSADSVVRFWRLFGAMQGHDSAVFFLSNNEDYVFMVQWGILGELDVLKLVAFDGDTVAVIERSASDGMIVDHYEDIDGCWKYRVDLWGDCLSFSEEVVTNENPHEPVLG